MLKFNFSNLNNRFKNVFPKEKEPEQTEVAPEQVILPRAKPRYSAYRTVVMRHEELSARLSGNRCDCNEESCTDIPLTE